LPRDPSLGVSVFPRAFLPKDATRHARSLESD
jgi:hypothetical protein